MALVPITLRFCQRPPQIVRFRTPLVSFLAAGEGPRRGTRAFSDETVQFLPSQIFPYSKEGLLLVSKTRVFQGFLFYN